MKPIKALGLTAVAALAAMALLGASSASAAIHLCSVNTTPCPSGNNIAIPHKVESTLHAGTESVLKAGFSEVKCQESSLSGEVENEETQTGPERIQQLVGKIISFIKRICHSFGGLVSCTTTPIQLPWTLHLTQKSPEEQGNGNAYIGPSPVSTGEQPGWKTVCGTTECTYKVKETQPEHSGTWGKMQFKGGNPAQIIVNQLELMLVQPSSSSCASSGFWNATYDVTNPNPVWLDS